MREFRDQLAETKKVIAKNAEHITRLQRQIGRLEKDGQDIAPFRALLSQFHELHMQLLAAQAMLVKTLQLIGAR